MRDEYDFLESVKLHGTPVKLSLSNKHLNLFDFSMSEIEEKEFYETKINGIKDIYNTIINMNDTSICDVINIWRKPTCLRVGCKPLFS